MFCNRLRKSVVRRGDRKGKERASGHAARRGARCRFALRRAHEAQPRGSVVFRPRQVRAFCGTRFEYALQRAASLRLRHSQGGSRVLPSAPQQAPRAPRARSYPWRGDEHGSSRTGNRQRRGHGAFRKDTRRALQPRRVQRDRPLYLCPLRRRLHDGGTEL